MLNGSKNWQMCTNIIKNITEEYARCEHEIAEPYERYSCLENMNGHDVKHI